VVTAPNAPLLNIDAGEHDTEPEELYALADLVHVACGGHAGDGRSMARVIRACLRSGTRVGAHPSYVDREGFGRTRLDVDVGTLALQIAVQLEALRDAADAAGAAIASMKPHGALYHAAATDDAIAEACVAATARVLGAVDVVGPATGGALARTAARHGLAYRREAFADRGVRADGSLVPRGTPGALVNDPARAAERARELAARGDVDTLCIHGDTEGALAIARAVRAALGARA
jgi:UPF0271 protein